MLKICGIKRYYFEFPKSNTFTIYANGKVYHKRVFSKPQTFVEVNFPYRKEVVYYFEPKIKHYREAPIRRISIDVELPDPQREGKETKGIKIIKLGSGFSPAYIDRKSNTIFTTPVFDKLNIQQRLFILLHEMGHYLYKDEISCDNFALYNYIKSYYNPSQAVSAMIGGLVKLTEQSKERLLNIYNKCKS